MLNRKGTNYLRYLEALALSLLTERERNGKSEFDIIEGIDMFGKEVTYSPYNAKQAIREAMEQPLDEEVIWIRNEKAPPKLAKNEFVGEPFQSTWIDPLGKSDYVHEGYSVEELKRDGKVGVYRRLSDWAKEGGRS